MPTFVRFDYRGRVAFGLLDGGQVRELGGGLFDPAAPTGRMWPIGDVRLLAPCEPGKVIAVGLNYRSHLQGRPIPTEPGLFAKLPSAICGPGDAIVVPPGATHLHYEGEMVVVIGRRAKRVPAGEAGTVVLGVTAGNDVSERIWQKNDLQWFRAKGCDTFGPIGPGIVTGLNFDDLALETRVNGEVRQSQRTSDLIFDVGALVSYITQFVTLLPGDVIFTGTPGRTGGLQPGDVVEVELEGVGVLRNTVVAGD
jgi:2-keto-4-pentenoate hydratase/2-oxohepta-3-ene-1,7-dioic acid hydratase in catechol pathway